MIKAKAITENEYSGAIVVSFDAKWRECFQAGKIRSVIRKRAPKTARAEWMYIYANSPASSLVARAYILSVGDIGLASAIDRRDDLYLSINEIKTYFGDASTVGIYELKAVELAKTPPSLVWLRNHLVFYPPQSFFFLASKAKTVIDRYAKF